jgi:hypothetical protein
VLGQALADVFDLEHLAQILTNRQRLVAWFFQSLEGLVEFDDLGHLGFDGGEVVFAQLVRQVEVVVKAIVDRRAERQLHALVEPHHRPGHDVGRAVPHDGQRVGVFLSKQPQGDFAIGR